MSHKALQIDIPEHKQAEFKRLTRTPELAVRTVIMGLLTTICVALGYVGYFTQTLPLWAAMAVITLGYYYTFTPIHDALHRALSSKPKLNDTIGGLNAFLVSPYVGIYPGLRFFRWFHMQHHRFTNGPKDPDNFVHGKWYVMPFKWAVIDYYYTYLALRDKDKIAVDSLKKMAPFIVVFLGIIGTLIYMGYGFEVLFLWYIPSRITWVMLGFIFFWAPHAHNGHTEHNVVQADNPTLATTVRIGLEAIMTPISQHQNYHLIHHLWPTTPYYNNYKVWKLLEDELRQCDLAIQHNLHIQPEIKLAPAKQAA